MTDTILKKLSEPSRKITLTTRNGHGRVRGRFADFRDHQKVNQHKKWDFISSVS